MTLFALVPKGTRQKTKVQLFQAFKVCNGVPKGNQTRIATVSCFSCLSSRNLREISSSVVALLHCYHMQINASARSGKKARVPKRVPFSDADCSPNPRPAIKSVAQIVLKIKQNFTASGGMNWKQLRF